MKMGAKFMAVAAVLGLAGLAHAASITMVDKGDVNTTGTGYVGGGVHAEFQVYQFVAAKTTETDKLNAVDFTVVSTAGEIHQIWGENVADDPDIVYTWTPGVGGVSSARQTKADSYFMESKFALTVTPRSEGMIGLIGDGSTYNAQYSGPASTIDPELSASGSAQAGFGTTFEFVGAVPTGSELDSYTLYQLVIPDVVTGTITVHIEVTSPSAGGVYVQEFVFGGEEVIPLPAAYPLGLAGLGLLAALRRRHA